MQTTKMSLANIQGKLSRAEMKNIMAGFREYRKCGGTYCGACTISSGADGNCHMPDSGTNAGKCFCISVS